MSGSAYLLPLMVGLRAVAWHRCDHRPAAEKDPKTAPTATCGGAVADAAVHPHDAAPTPPARAGVPATEATRIAAMDLAGIEAW
jgi:hypothetical protein